MINYETHSSKTSNRISTNNKDIYAQIKTKFYNFITTLLYRYKTLVKISDDSLYLFSYQLHLFGYYIEPSRRVSIFDNMICKNPCAHHFQYGHLISFGKKQHLLHGARILTTLKNRNSRKYVIK